MTKVILSLEYALSTKFTPNGQNIYLNGKEIFAVFVDICIIVEYFVMLVKTKYKYIVVISTK